MKFKKADNCIRCYQAEMNRYKHLISDINEVITTTACMDVAYKIKAILAKQPRRHFTKDELTIKCCVCHVIIRKGTSLDSLAISHGYCPRCAHEAAKDVTISIEEPEPLLTIGIDNQKPVEVEI
jgi:hypothetical protein